MKALPFKASSSKKNRFSAYINRVHYYEISGTGPRKEIWEIPHSALKEAIISLLSHRDYYDKGGRIMIVLFDDRLVITNPGGLVNAVPLKDFGKISHSRNPLVFGLFERMRMVEQVGSGISRMKSAMRNNNLKMPVFKTKATFIAVFERSENLQKTRGKIIKLLKNSPTLTRKEIADYIGMSIGGIDYHLRILVEKGLVKHEGSRKAGNWIVLKK